ncbi:MAG: TetR/AcrR family transcriptional regulator [Pseudomonadota bacterium]
MPQIPQIPRRKLNRIARETAILKAALEVFSQAGFSGATMEAVALSAGISKPTLYQYFDNKTALFDAMMQSKRLQMALAIDLPADGDMVAQLYRFCMGYARTVMRPDMLSLARLIIGEAQRFPEIGRAYQAAGPDKLLDDITQYLAARQTAGHLSFDDARMAAEDLWGLVLSAPRTRALHDPAITYSEDELQGFVHSGLKVFLRAYSTRVSADLTRLSDCIGAAPKAQEHLEKRSE